MIKDKRQKGSEKSKGIIFQTQRFSVHDGEGIRTTIFMKGCPLRCAWCANPESWKGGLEKNYGFEVSVKELMSIIQKDEAFYRESSGGVSFSGGEPFFQKDFLFEILKSCQNFAYDTAVESSAFFNWQDCKNIIPLLDTVFFDIKHMDSQKHFKFTGVDNKIILNNIALASKIHKRIFIRVPLIKDFNDSQENLEALLDFIKELKNIKGLEFLPYHDLALTKYEELNLPPPLFSPPSQEKISFLKDKVRKSGIRLIDTK